jgi:hypothetical protein
MTMIVRPANLALWVRGVRRFHNERPRIDADLQVRGTDCFLTGSSGSADAHRRGRMWDQGCVSPPVSGDWQTASCAQRYRIARPAPLSPHRSAIPPKDIASRRRGQPSHLPAGSPPGLDRHMSTNQGPTHIVLFPLGPRATCGCRGSKGRDRRPPRRRVRRRRAPCNRGAGITPLCAQPR